MPYKCGDTLGDRLWESPYSFWLLKWWKMRPLVLDYYLGICQSTSSVSIVEKVSDVFLGHFPKSQDSSGISQMVSKSLKTYILTCFGINLDICFTFPFKQCVSANKD